MDKACDLSSISVVPPHSRKRISALPTGMESSVLETGEAPAALASVTASQLRSQPWQQWFSQTAFSLEELFSQISLESLDDVLVTEQRLNSQNMMSSAKRVQFLLPPPEYICQISEEPQRTIGMMKTFLSRLGMVLDSTRKDIMHVNKGTEETMLESQISRELQLMIGNKGTKEEMLERETLRLKVAVLNNLLQSTLKQISFNVGAQRIYRSSTSVGHLTTFDSKRFPTGAFGTTIVGFKMCGFVFLCAEGRVVDRNERILEENVVKLEWISQSIFVAPTGQINIWRRVMAKVREHFSVNLPSSFDEIVMRLVEEANAEGDKVQWAEDLQYSFLVGGKLDHDQVCEMFHIKRIKKEDDPLFFRSQNKENHSHLYKSFPTDFVASGEEAEEFFGRKSMKSRLEKAKREYDRAKVAKIAKEYLAYACGIHRHSHGRATMVTIHESGFHIFESAYPVDDEHPEKGYRASRVDGFVPHGYAL